MTVRMKRVMLALVSGSALAIAPLLYATVAVPAISSADECTDSGGTGATGDTPCAAETQTLNCPDGTVVDEQNKQCVDLMAGISKQLQALPPPPSLAGGGAGSLGSLPGGIPSLGTVNMPDLVLPSLGLGLVPNLNLSLQPQLGGAAAPNLTQLPAPQLPPAPSVNPLNPLGLPPPPSVNPLNPLGLPPPPDLTPGIPFI